jgi:phosphoglycerate dehydrogenase-like enzyme
VSGSRGVFNHPMSQYVLAHVLSVYQHHRFFIQTQKDQQWRPSRHQEEIQGKKVAIIGVGQLGLAVAKTFAFFGAKVHGFNRTNKDSIYLEECFALTELEKRLQDYDVVVVTLALNSETKGLVNRTLIEKLSPQVIFVNISRDGVLDEEALVSALQQKKIRHAILDTFSQEPLPKTSPLWTLDNVTITPHISYTSVDNLKRMFEALLTNIQLYRQNEVLINQFK